MLVKRDGVSMYSEMASMGKVVKVLRQGEVVIVEFAVTSTGGSWCYIVEGAGTQRAGYVRCEDLTRERPRPARQHPAGARQAQPTPVAPPAAQPVPVPPAEPEVGELPGPRTAANPTSGTLLAVGLAAVLLGGATYHGMLRPRLRVRQAWSGIGIQLRRRTALIPGLVEAVQSHAADEREVFEEVHLASTAVAQAGGATEAALANQRLTAALVRLFGVAENHAELRASESFLALKKELTDTDDELALARELYKRAAQHYNRRIQTRPVSRLARAAGFAPAALFEATGVTPDEVPAAPPAGPRLPQPNAAPIAAEAGHTVNGPSIQEDTARRKDVAGENYFRLTGDPTLVYASPEVGAPVRAQLPAGTVVMFVGMKGNFLRVVMANSVAGYISSAAPMAWVQTSP
jgi:LemA protein